MQSNGGCLPADRAAHQAHRLVLSGPAAGVAGTVALGAKYGIGQLISLDMGGTSLDVCLIPDGIPPVTARQEIGGRPRPSPPGAILPAGARAGSTAHAGPARGARGGPRAARPPPPPGPHAHR